MKIHRTELHNAGRTMNVWTATESEADQRREDAAFWRAAARRRAANGEPVTALLFNNLAWLAENGMDAWEFARRDGKLDDTEVKP
jgi:hypothetical protein